MYRLLSDDELASEGNNKCFGDSFLSLVRLINLYYNKQILNFHIPFWVVESFFFSCCLFMDFFGFFNSLLSKNQLEPLLTDTHSAT